MFVECIKNNGVPYLRLVEGVRVTNKNGYRTSQKKVILYLGPLSRFDDGEPDYVARLKQSFKDGDPLIPELKPYCSKEQPPETYSVQFKEGSPCCIGHPRLFSQLLLERVLEEIGLYSLVLSCKHTSGTQYDVCGFFKLLVFGRVLHPASGCPAVRQNGDYYEPVLEEGSDPDNVYDALAFIAQNRDRIIRRMNTNLVRKAHRSPETIFYGVTDFRPWAEEPDGGSPDGSGAVRTGLFMDGNGIPVSVETFPGNTLDHQTMRSALGKNIDGLDSTRFILVADLGKYHDPDLLRLLDQGDGYIVPGSLSGGAQEEREWAYSTEGYTRVNEGFRYKSRIVESLRMDRDGKERPVEEKVVVYWSEKIKDRRMAENRSFLEFLKDPEGSPTGSRITAARAKSLCRFLGLGYTDRETGDITDPEKIRGMIDHDRVRDLEEEMGYCQVVTSELAMDDREVIERYYGLRQIGDQFRVMKGALEARPIYARNPEYTEAQLVLCLVALVVTRIIQERVNGYGGPAPGGDGEAGTDRSWISAERLQDALNKWMVDILPEDLYRFDNTDDADLKRILDAFGIRIPEKLYRRGELKQIKTGTQIFI